MSVSDDLMWRYYDLLSFRGAAEITGLKTDFAGGCNPRDVKVQLAQELLVRFHSQKDAEEALADFVARFRQGALPEDMPGCEVNNGGLPLSIV